MISISAIDRALENRDYDRLLQSLSRNGLVMPLPLRVQLAESAVGARGLGLRRLVELTYGPTALTRQITRALIHAQQPNGALADAAGRSSALLTAAFAAGLGRVLRDHAGLLGEEHEPIRSAYEHALATLASMQDDAGLFAGPQDRNLRDRLLTSAFIAYLLIDAPQFAARCQGHTLLTTLEDHLDHCPRDTAELIDMARLTRLLPAAQADQTHRIATATRNHQPNLLTAA